ncbi:DUF3618 domain-containing protein [Micromonospora rifamycinica]|uniref:DUF3618 domain-containing protein n=1 Tax=Micromonospora TaxID=1873 RepID=UPI00249C4873|nr:MULTISPECIES: DUF3618 domain-containing protein [Micromonospora]WFE66740.1 DUF3618 domain-containing protein [Micromonospora sp. WMMD714]
MTGTTGSNGNGSGDTEALREEIRRTRSELGETMELLAAKADVKARLKDSAEQAKERVREQAALTVARVRSQAAQGADVARAQAYDTGVAVRGNPVPWATVAAGAVAVVVVLLIIRGRRR